MQLQQLSIRARVALGARCLELILDDKNINYLEDNGWKYVLKHIWSYTHINPGSWHYLMAELTPFSIEEEIPFADKGFEYLEESDYYDIRTTYSAVDSDIKKIVDLIFEIGTLDLYSSIKGNSPRTLLMLEEIISILIRHNLEIPKLKRHKKFDILENNGWGIEFDKSNFIASC
jgi:hypothetical protein